MWILGFCRCPFYLRGGPLPLPFPDLFQIQDLRPNSLDLLQTQGLLADFHEI
jgi:hypothetical protein